MKFIKFILVLVVFLNFVKLTSQQNDLLPLKDISIAIVKDGPASRNFELESQLKNEIISLLSGQANASFFDESEITGNWTMQSVSKIIDKLLINDKVDIIITLGAISSQNICLRKKIDKPVIAAFVSDYKLQNIPFVNGRSGKDNLSYIIIPQRVESDLNFYSKLVKFKNVSIVLSKIYLKEMLGLTSLESKKDSLSGIRIDYIMADSSAAGVLELLPEDCEAVYFSNMLHFSNIELKKFIDEINLKKIPSFGSNLNQVKLGFLTSLYTDIQDRLLRRIAMNIQQIILGEKPAEFPVEIFTNTEMSLNLKTFELIGKMVLNWDIITNADIVESGINDKDAKLFDISEIIQIAIDSNLDLIAKDFETKSIEKNIDITRSYLLPSLNLDVQGQKNGNSNPEETVQLQLSANQLIYSQSLSSDLEVSKYMFEAKQNELLATQLDLIKTTSEYYLNVMKSRKDFLILWENLRNSRKNLTIAKQKFDAGAVDKSEVIRWESQVASAKKSAVSGYAVLMQDLLQLFQVLNTKNLSNYDIANLTLDDPLLLTSRKSFIEVLENPIKFDKLSQFFIDEAIKNSPEIKQIDYYLTAKKEHSGSLQKSHFIPEFYGYGTYYNYLYQNETNLYMPKNDWTLGVKMSLPLLKGFSVVNSIEQTEIDIQQLNTQRNSTIMKIEQSVKTSLNYLETTYFNIQQSIVAEKSAEENLQLVNNSYLLGDASFLLLLDAQTQLFSAQLEANDSYITFLKTYFDLQRLIGNFDPLLSQTELDSFLNRLLEFVNIEE